MTSRDFAFWLQGFFEVQEPTKINPKQTEMIKNHLALVFKHEIDPSYSDDPNVQEEMNQIHGGGAVKPEPPQFPADTVEDNNFWGKQQHNKPDDGHNTLLRC